MVQCSSTENFGAIQTLNASSETITPKRINLEIAVGMPVEIGTMPRRKHFLMKGHIRYSGNSYWGGGDFPGNLRSYKVYLVTDL